MEHLMRMTDPDTKLYIEGLGPDSTYWFQIVGVSRRDKDRATLVVDLCRGELEDRL